MYKVSSLLFLKGKIWAILMFWYEGHTMPSMYPYAMWMQLKNIDIAHSKH